MDLSNNELFQMLLTDIINMNNQIANHNNNYIYNNYNENTLFNTIINNIQNGILNDYDDVPPLFPIFPFYNNSAPNSQAVLHQSLYDRTPIKHVITEEVKNGLSPIKFTDAKEREINDKCSISMEKFNDDDDIIQLPCNHCFCVESIMHWLTEESCECPVCRYKFDSMEKNTRHIEGDEIVEIIGVEDFPDLMEIDDYSIEHEHEHEHEYEYEDEDEDFINDSTISSLSDDID
jgi:hypothetical protein